MVSEAASSRVRLRAAVDDSARDVPVGAPHNETNESTRQRHGDAVIGHLFRAGLQLQAVLPLVDAHVRDRLTAATDSISDAIREIRNDAFWLDQHQVGRP